MSTQTVIYLHGFNSSPESLKARLFTQYIQQFCPNVEIIVPELPFSALKAIELISTCIERRLTLGTVGLVGSSLGGYYGLYLAERYQLKAALINPALRPYELLADYLGPNVNLYTGEVHELQWQHVDELLALKVSELSLPKNIFVLTQTGDETIPYHQAVEQLPSSPFWIQAGGNHDFIRLASVIPAIMAFLFAS